MSPENPKSGNYQVSSGIEFRASDGAWYGVQLILRGDTLTVKYDDFSDDDNVVFYAKDLKSLKEVEYFRKRFRKGSVQLQDFECSKVVEGTRVCASRSLGVNDVRYYDAIVEGVECKEHSFSNGEEECLCTFILFWQHGPNAGNLTFGTIADLCLIQSSSEIDPAVASFSKISLGKITNATCCSGLNSADNLPACGGNSHQEESCNSNAKQISNLLQCGTQETKYGKPSVNKLVLSEGAISNHCDYTRQECQDVDLGASGFYYTFLIDNVEKNLSPLAVKEFILKQTSILTQAYIFPSWSSESYTRGAIILDCTRNVKKLYDFLDNPKHLIVSSRGRPWVIVEQVSRPGTFILPIGTLMLNSVNKLRHGSTGTSNELKVVFSETEEYRIAKLLKDMFKDFSDHQQRLHASLAFEERKILLPSHAP